VRRYGIKSDSWERHLSLPENMRDMSAIPHLPVPPPSLPLAQLRGESHMTEQMKRVVGGTGVSLPGSV